MLGPAAAHAQRKDPQQQLLGLALVAALGAMTAPDAAALELGKLDPHGEIQRSYGVIGLPTTFLIGRNGRAGARAIGPRDWAAAPSRKLLQKLLQEPSPPAMAPSLRRP